MNDLDSTTDGYAELAGPTAHGGKGWEPIIGYYSPAPSAFADSVPEGFAGIFDGQGHEIRDLFVNRPDESGVAIFSIVSGSVEDTGAVNATVTGRDSVGGLVASLDDSGSVTDSYYTGSVTGQRWVGGLIGMSYGSARNSRFAGTVTGEESVGGLVGWNGIGATLSNSYSTGDVTGGDSVGGLVGSSSSGSVNNSYSTGSVTGDESVGGLVGWNHEGVLSNCFWDTETSGQSTSAGGTGMNTTEMKNIGTFTDVATEGLDEPWDMITVASSVERNPSYIWNIVDGVTYPFLNWQSTE
jgi:hypothetical protein